MKTWKTLLCLALAAVLSVGLLAGCGTTTTPPVAATPTPADPGAPAAPEANALADKMFNVALTAPFTGFDPLRTNDSASTYVNVQMYETLYRIHPVTGEYFCLLAEEFPVYSADGSHVSIKLREGITFHDGTPFNAEAVKYTMDLIQDPDFGSLRASIASSFATIEVEDEYTIAFDLSYEDGVLLAKLAHTNSAIISPTAHQSGQDLMIVPVGTGPYKFVSMVSGSNVVLTRYDEYWNGPAAVKDVTMTIIAEESTAIARMETGEADFMPVISVEQLGRLDSMPNVVGESSEAAQIYYMCMRADSYVNPIMANKDFRTALAMGIDKVGYVEFIMEGYSDVAPAVIGPKIFGYTPAVDTAEIGYDVAAAKAILDANPGWANEEIKLLVPSTPAYLKMGEYFQSSLGKAGFTNIQIEQIDWSAWLTESRVDDRFDITFAAWSNVTRDGTELMEPNFHSTTGQRRIRIEPDQWAILDEFIFNSKTTSDIAIRSENLAAANNFLVENAYVQPIYNNTNLYCYNTAYTGLTRDAGGTFYMYDVGFAN